MLKRNQILVKEGSEAQTSSISTTRARDYFVTEFSINISYIF